MDLIINKTMTDYAHLILPDYKKNMQQALGLAPLTPTGTMAGQYMAFDDKQAFIIPKTARVAGGETADAQFSGRMVDYILESNGLKTFIDDEIEVPLAGAGASLLERAKVATLLSQGANAFTTSVFDKIIAGTTPVAGKGVWEDDAVDPLEELDEGLQAIETNSGISGNVITIAKPMWRRLVKHPKVIKHFPGKIGPITKELVALELGETDLSIEIVSGRGFRTGNLGGAAGATTVPFMGNSAFVHYREPNPGPLSASFAATLAQSEDMIENVYEYTSLDGTKRYFRIRWALKSVIKSALLAYRIDKTSPAAKPAAAA